MKNILQMNQHMPIDRILEFLNFHISNFLKVIIMSLFLRA